MVLHLLLFLIDRVLAVYDISVKFVTSQFYWLYGNVLDNDVA